MTDDAGPRLRFATLGALEVTGPFGRACVKEVRIIVIAAIAILATTIAGCRSSPEGDLQALTREAVAVAHGTSCFKTLEINGSPATRLGWTRIPKGYHAVMPRRNWWQQPPPFVLVASSSRNCFVALQTRRTADSIAIGYQGPAAWLTTVQGLVQPVLGPGYSVRYLHNGVVYAAAGKPTVELVLVQSGLPSMRRDRWSYELFMLVFQRGSTILRLYEPCEWWTLPGTTRWTMFTFDGVCDQRWIPLSTGQEGW
jgi:hypothetical protein